MFAEQISESPDDVKSVISTKNMELDSKLGGGLPVGCLTLIEGPSGSGKSVLAQQIAWGALQDGFTVTLFTSENTVKSLVSQMQSIDLDILDFLLLGKIRIYPVELAGHAEQAPAALMKAIQHQSSRSLVIVDSLTSALANYKLGPSIVGFFEACKRLTSDNISILVTLHSHVIEDDLIGTIRSLCDAHLRVHAEQDGQRMMKTLEVTKIRGARSSTGAVVGFDVEPGWGIRVIPISKARG